MIEELTVRTANTADLPAVLALLKEASAWLRSKGVDQWQRPPRVDRLRADIERGEVFLAEDGTGEPIATLTLTPDADPDFWTSADEPHAALYVHRLVTARRVAGHGLGAALLDWAAQRAHRQGHRWLRLDAWRTNQGLLDYYRRLGWTHLRTVNKPGRFSGALFQTDTSHRCANHPVKIIDHTDEQSN